MEIRNATTLIGERLRRNRIVHERFTKNPDANTQKLSWHLYRIEGKVCSFSVRECLPCARCGTVCSFRKDDRARVESNLQMSTHKVHNTKSCLYVVSLSEKKEDHWTSVMYDYFLLKVPNTKCQTVAVDVQNGILAKSECGRFASQLQCVISVGDIKRGFICPSVKIYTFNLV